ncbi:MAG: hypothetical protein CMM76_13325 [Rhodospirillaceae bacterium]|nr:hypothetical protein [Rhodospirillaceae bacterium]
MLGDQNDGLACAHDLLLSITRWTGRVLEGLFQYDGHGLFISRWQRAACKQDQNGLLVSSIIQTDKPIGAKSHSVETNL